MIDKMPEKIYYSKDLDLKYKIKFGKGNNKVYVCEDNVNYVTYEKEKIDHLSKTDRKNIHLVKKIFNGVVI